MTIAFDAFTQAECRDCHLSHTPVGTPRGVIYLMLQNTAADQVATRDLWRGGVDRDPGSPLLGAPGDEDMTLYTYFLGAGIPTGVQSVVVDTTSDGRRRPPSS